MSNGVSTGWRTRWVKQVNGYHLTFIQVKKRMQLAPDAIGKEADHG